MTLRWKLRGSSDRPQVASYTRRSSATVNSSPQNAVAYGEYSSLARARSTPAASTTSWSKASRPVSTSSTGTQPTERVDGPGRGAGRSAAKTR